MTTASAPLSEPAPLPSLGTWRQRAIEALLIGGGTLVLYPLAWLLRRSLGAESAEDAVDFFAYHAALVINNPHFAVTYLLFYRGAKGHVFSNALPPAQRARYLFAGFVVPLLLAIWAIWALRTRSAPTLGYLIQLMFFLVGWHYVKQGFGILTVVSLRRGFRFSPLERTAALAHSFAAWAYAWASPYDPGKTAYEKGVVYTSIAHPRWLEPVTFYAFIASTALLVAVLARRTLRDRRLPPLSPLVAFLISLWLWLVYSSIDRLMMYLIPALHSVQYLYMVYLVRRNEARAFEGPPHFGKPAGVRLLSLAVFAVGLGWLLFRGVPSFLDGALGPGRGKGAAPALGETPYFAAIFVVVNIHHYFMDNVIWRRESPLARYLRDEKGEMPSPSKA